MGKNVMAALWLTVAVTFAWQVGATQVGKGLGVNNLTVTEALTEENYNKFFPHKDDALLAHAVGFYDYQSFLRAAAMFEAEGFGLKGGATVQRQELSAFLAHAAHMTTCGWSKSLDGPYAWGLCYSQELSPSSTYCQEDFRYPCVNGVSYHGRGVFPLYYNFNYGTVGNALKLDFLGNPDLVANNATLAFATAIWQWVTPQKPNPSPHSVMVNEWVPKKEDTDNFRKAGFGLTINILNGQIECGHGEDPRGNDRISHYTRFISDILEEPLGANLNCGEQGMLPVGFTAVL